MFYIAFVKCGLDISWNEETALPNRLHCSVHLQSFRLVQHRPQRFPNFVRMITYLLYEGYYHTGQTFSGEIDQ